MNYRNLRVPDDIAVRWDTPLAQAWRRGVDQAINTTSMDEARAGQEPKRGTRRPATRANSRT